MLSIKLKKICVNNSNDMSHIDSSIANISNFKEFDVDYFYVIENPTKW